MIKVNYFTNQKIHLEEETKYNRSYECFGWSLPDLLSDVINPPIGSPEFLKSEEYDSGVSFEKSQLVSDESLTSGSQWDKLDLNSKEEDENVSEKQAFEEENERQNELNQENSVSSINLAKSNFINGESGTLPNQVVSREQLIALINSKFPNCKEFERILQDVSASILQTASPSNTATPSKSNQKKQRTSLYEKSQGRICNTELEELVLTVEHEATNRDLEEPRAMFLKAASGLNSRLTALDVDTQQLYSELNNLQQDFQIQENAVTRMTNEAHRLVSDLQNLRYLDDLIFLLQGQLDRITLQNWPFLLAHVLPQNDSTQELNLLV